MHLVSVVAAQGGALGAPTLLTVLWALVQVGAAAGAVLVLRWLAMLLWRERTTARLARQFPEQAQEIRRAARRAPLLRGPRAPEDPLARTHQTVIPPRGDGRPGESFWTAAPAQLNPFEPGPDGSGQDALVLLAPGVHLLVHCAGRIGARWGEHVVLPARERAQAARDHRGEGAATPTPGPIDRLMTPAGEAWRVTLAYPGGRMLSDTHVDREGWGFIVGVLSTSNHPRAVELADHVLETWRWRPAQAEGDPSTRSA